MARIYTGTINENLSATPSGKPPKVLGTHLGCGSVGRSAESKQESMKLPLRILHLEDNRQDSELIQATLASDFLCDVVRVETEAEFLAAIEPGGFDLILVDYSLPAFDGAAALPLTSP